MRNRGQITLAIAIIVIGALVLVANLFHIDVGQLCWPLVLISAGVWVLLRPYLINADTAVELRFIGDIRRAGNWQVENEEIWTLVGDIDLDMTQATLPAGETRLRVFGCVSDIDMLLPHEVGYLLVCTAFVTDARVGGNKRDYLLTPLKIASDNYETAERRVRLEATFFVGTVKVRQV